VSHRTQERPELINDPVVRRCVPPIETESGHFIYLLTEKTRDTGGPILVVYCEGSVYYEGIPRELNRRLIYECRCDERLKTKVEGSTLLVYTGLCGGLEHLKIETWLIDERFESEMGECVI
jgi:hypothetical protein